MLVRRLLEFLFTWWNGNTLGTKLYTFLNGKKVGDDYFGNSYFESKDKKNRWCIYSNQSDASKISPEWNSWLRFISDTSPKSIGTPHNWQKLFNGNETGLDCAKPGTVGAVGLKEDLDSYKRL